MRIGDRVYFVDIDRSLGGYFDLPLPDMATDKHSFAKEVMFYYDRELYTMMSYKGIEHEIKRVLEAKATEATERLYL
jgi:hypothetical protein